MKKKIFTKDDLTELEQKKYDRWASWAIWDEGDITNTECIREKSDKLKTTCVIIGLNQSEGKPNKDKWFNFHAKKTGCRDTWLREAFNNSPVTGAYMTDLLKIRKTNGIDSFLENKINSTKIKEQIKNFQKELKEVGITDKSTFILLGKQVQRYFNFFLKENFIPKKRIDLPHYAGHIKKDKWLKEVRNQINREF